MRLVCILSENHTLVSPRDLPALVRMAVEAERAGFDAVMVSEHVVLGGGSNADGVPANPRAYALPGNQGPGAPGPAAPPAPPADRGQDRADPSRRRRCDPPASPSSPPREGARHPRPPQR